MQTIKIDFDNPGLPQRLDVVENDAQSRFFKAVLYKDGKAYTAPSGAKYSIMYQGFGPQNEGWYDTINDGAGKRAACSVSGNVVTCEIARQALRVPGHVSVVLCATGSNGYMLHGWPIDCNCRNDSYTSGTSVESFFYITQVTNANWTSAIQTWEELKNMIDPTLSLSGKAADAAKVGEAVGEIKEDKVDKPSTADDGKVPRAKDGEVEWVEVGQPTDDQTDNAVTKWLDRHPEATTTVQDGTITKKKINAKFLPYIEKDYVTPQMFGAKGDGISDDSESFKEALKHKSVFIPSGTYILSTNLEVSGRVVGADETSTILKFNNIPSESYAFTVKSNFTNMSNLTIISEYTSETYESCEYNGINCDYVWNLSFNNIQARLFKIGIHLNNSWNDIFSECTFSRCQTGVLGDSETNNDIFRSCFIKYNKIGIRKKDGTNFILDGSDLSYNTTGFQQEGIGISSVVKCYFEQNATSIKQFYGLRAPYVVHVDNCNFYSLNIDNEVVISVTSGDVTISNCLFKNLGNYKPKITNKKFLLHECTVIGDYTLYGKNVIVDTIYNVPNHKIYASITTSGLAVLTISALPATDTNILFTLPDELRPAVGLRAYATFKDDNENRAVIEITVSDDGKVYTSKEPSKAYNFGHITISYPIK